jgi:hypothetical protein
MRLILILGLCFSLVATGLARADDDPDLSPHASAFRRARAEIIAGSIISVFSAFGVIMSAAFLWMSFNGCQSSEDCGTASLAISILSGIGGLIEGMAGLPLLLDGIVRRADARAAIVPIAGPGTAGVGLRLSF